MSQNKDNPIKKHAGKAVIGLNAAAIVFLYTNFVPRHEYEKLERKCEKLEEKLSMTREGLAVVNGIIGQTYE